MAAPPDGKHGKRVRTIYTQEQLERLEHEFEKQQYMVGTERLVFRVNREVWHVA